MKKLLMILLWVVCDPLGWSVTDSLTVYTYDSLTGKNSFGEFLATSFLKKTGIKVEFVSFGTSGEALNQVLLEGKSTKADLVMGMDELLFLRLKSKDLFEKADSPELKNIEPHLMKDRLDPAFVPFDYGYLAFVFDTNRVSLPSNLRLSTFSKWLGPKQKIALQDPRTSSLGLEFLVWTCESLGAGAKAFWQGISPSVLTFSPGWSGAYELFLKNQVDFVLSYTTSPAYHRMREGKNHIAPLLFAEGHFKQVEGLGILKSSSHKELAQKFVDWVLSKDSQNELPTFQWMYPARKDVRLPREFKEIPVPQVIKINWSRVESEKEKWTKEWALWLSQDHK